MNTKMTPYLLFTVIDTLFNEIKDSVTQHTFSYGANHLEIITTTWFYNPYWKSSSLTVTDYTASGRIQTQRTYLPSNQLYSQTDYVYTLDANNNLLKTVQTDLSGNVSEARFTNNSFGKPEKEERYYQNKLALTLYYYYE